MQSSIRDRHETQCRQLLIDTHALLETFRQKLISRSYSSTGEPGSVTGYKEETFDAYVVFLFCHSLTLHEWNRPASSEVMALWKFHTSFPSDYERVCLHLCNKRIPLPELPEGWEDHASIPDGMCTLLEGYWQSQKSRYQCALPGTTNTRCSFLALIPAVFRNHIMDHLGYIDMIALQRTCTYGHRLVFLHRSIFTRTLHTFIETKVQEWIGKDIGYFIRTKTQQKDSFAFLTGSALLAALNREYWTPNNANMIILNKQGIDPGIISDNNRTKSYRRGGVTVKINTCNKLPLCVTMNHETLFGVPFPPSLESIRTWLDDMFDLDFTKNVYDGVHLHVFYPESILERRHVFSVSGPACYGTDLESLTESYRKRDFTITWQDSNEPGPAVSF